MGLIKAGSATIKSTMADQWKEFFYCDSLPQDILVKKGRKRINDKSSNTNGSEDIISNGSGIVVADGQCMIIVDQGRVVELCSEPGEYTYDKSTEPSLFTGPLGESVIETFKTMWKRFSHGGDTGKDQRVYYFNIKEIMDNKYGTPQPIPFRVVDKNIGLDIDISIRCHGVYSYKITDPLLFYVNVCGNIQNEYKRSEIDNQLKAELLTALQPAFARISSLGVRYSALPGHTMEMTEALNEILKKKWKELRGVEVSSMAMSSVTADEKDEEMIKQAQRTALLRDPSLAAATLVEAQGEAMKTAAGNDAGAMIGFMGMNMAAQAGGANIQGLYGMKQETVVEPQSKATWTCSCGHVNTGKFCEECGKPQDKGWTCVCGSVNKGKFCSQCGTKKPDDVPLYCCDKCGWEPEDPHHPPKFCPECGDPFDDNDKK
ncbi:MAG: SPFH domain-containing protein [Erysipelotrichales bacterium]|nr:SPFH domain-containing protein [Erysipelotrichales bacterium]